MMGWFSFFAATTVRRLPGTLLARLKTGIEKFREPVFRFPVGGNFPIRMTPLIS